MFFLPAAPNYLKNAFKYRLWCENMGIAIVSIFWENSRYKMELKCAWGETREWHYAFFSGWIKIWTLWWMERGFDYFTGKWESGLNVVSVSPNKYSARRLTSILDNLFKPPERIIRLGGGASVLKCIPG